MNAFNKEIRVPFFVLLFCLAPTSALRAGEQRKTNQATSASDIVELEVIDSNSTQGSKELARDNSRVEDHVLRMLAAQSKKDRQRVQSVTEKVIRLFRSGTGADEQLELSNQRRTPMAAETMVMSPDNEPTTWVMSPDSSQVDEVWVMSPDSSRPAATTVMPLGRSRRNRKNQDEVMVMALDNVPETWVMSPGTSRAAETMVMSPDDEPTTWVMSPDSSQVDEVWVMSPDSSRPAATTVMPLGRSRRNRKNQDEVMVMALDNVPETWVMSPGTSRAAETMVMPLGKAKDKVKNQKKKAKNKAKNKTKSKKSQKKKQAKNKKSKKRVK